MSLPGFPGPAPPALARLDGSRSAPTTHDSSSSASSASSDEESSEPESDIDRRVRQAWIAYMENELEELSKLAASSLEEREACDARMQAAYDACEAAECPRDRCFKMACLIVRDFHRNRAVDFNNSTNSEYIEDNYDELLSIETAKQLYPKQPAYKTPEHLAVKRQTEMVRWKLLERDLWLRDRKARYEQGKHEAEQRLRDYRIMREGWLRNKSSTRKEICALYLPQPGDPDPQERELQYEVLRSKYLLANIKEKIEMRIVDQNARIRGEKPIYTVYDVSKDLVGLELEEYFPAYTELDELFYDL